LSESALKHGLLLISVDFSQFHQKSQKVISFRLPIEWRIFLSKHAFLSISDDFSHQKIKKSFSSNV